MPGEGPRDGSRWRTFAAEIRRGIASGLYPVGTRLPSVTGARDQFGVSDSTVVSAYAALAEEGLIEKRPSSGHWVLRRLPPADLEQRLTAVEQGLDEVRRHLGLQ